MIQKTSFLILFLLLFFACISSFQVESDSQKVRLTFFQKKLAKKTKILKRLNSTSIHNPTCSFSEEQKKEFCNDVMSVNFYRKKGIKYENLFNINSCKMKKIFLLDANSNRFLLYNEYENDLMKCPGYDDKTGETIDVYISGAGNKDAIFTLRQVQLDEEDLTILDLYISDLNLEKYLHNKLS